MLLTLPWYLGDSRSFTHSWTGDLGMGTWIVPLAVWSVLWTGLALWHAAKRDDKGWFVFFLLVHTAGIIEILYLVLVAKALGQQKKSSRRRSR